MELHPLFNQGVEASSRSDWHTAAQELDIAAQRDPALAFNWFQAGMAHGELALAADGSLTNRSELDRAIDNYHRGLAIEPRYATNWANLAALEWAAGERETALASIQRAADAATRQPFFRLTLGRMLEESGKAIEARREYEAALTQSPGWIEAYFFRATPFRQQLAEQWRRSHPTPPTEELEGLSVQELQMAGTNQVYGTNSTQYFLALADAYRREGRNAEAIQAYETLLDQLEQTSSFGIGQLDNPQYGWYIFDRQSIAADLLPGVDTIVYTDRVVKGMLDLASLYQKTGREPDAILIYRKILTAAPDIQIARNQLAKLE